MEADTKACPVCGETIKAAALKCRFCNTDLAAYNATKELETEKEIFSGRPAALYSIGQFVPFLVIVAAAITAVYFTRSSAFKAYEVLGALVLCGLFGLRYYMKSLGTHYIITTQRIKLEHGLLSKVQQSLELFRIDHFELRKPLGSRLLGFADLHLYSSDAEFGSFTLYGMRGLEALAEELRECQLRERSRRSLTTFVKA